EELAQQIESLEHPVIVRKQRILALEANLTQAFHGRRMNNRITKSIEITEIDPPAVRAELFVKSHCICFRTGEIKWQVGCPASRKQHFGLLERLAVRRLIPGACRRTL